MDGLDALKRIAYENACIRCQYYVDKQCWNKGECVWKDIEKELKALNIIKRRPLEIVDYIEIYDSWEEYSQDIYRKERWIKTKEEFDLLKEILY